MGERYPSSSRAALLDSHHNTLHQKLQGAWFHGLSSDPATQLLAEGYGLWPKYVPLMFRWQLEQNGGWN